MSGKSAVTATAAGRVGGRGATWVARLARWMLRAVVTLHALDAFAQPVLAGRFLSGAYPMLGTHGKNAIVVAVLGFAQTVVAIGFWRPGCGPGWPALASAGLSIAEPIQIALGFNRVVGVHVPLGVAIVVAVALVTFLVWRPAFGRPDEPDLRAPRSRTEGEPL